MKFTLNDIEYTIKTRQAIEILNLAEKSGILDKVKKFNGNITESNAVDLIGLIPQAYNLASEVVAIATGTFSKGVLTPNTDLVDDMEAVQVPVLAFNIVKTLIFPVQYVITDDTLGNEKKTSPRPPQNTEESHGKPVENSVATVSSEISTTPSVTTDSKQV